ncbi:MAG TPA: hypothetical protein VH413_15040 [Verrucomicrobiae bacterium]|jgi:hypothetical protein|nr:hypothetical protein [Verrucomicrobiae bacterium]
MFNLEREIKAWRREMRRAGIRTSNTLDELESHLRAEFEILTASDGNDKEAFQTAKSHVGKSHLLSVEFDKVKNSKCWPVIISRAFWIVLLVLFIGMWPVKSIPQHSFFDFRTLAVATVFALSAGHSAWYLAGVLCIVFICFRSTHTLTNARAAALEQAVWGFSLLAAGFVFLAFILGIIGNHHFMGVFWDWNSFWIWTLVRLIFLAGFIFAQRFAGWSQHKNVVLYLAGALVINLAWTIISTTGVNIMAIWRLMFWPAWFSLAVQALALAWTVMPARRESTREFI